MTALAPFSFRLLAAVVRGCAIERGTWWRAGMNVGTSVLAGLAALGLDLFLVKGFR